MNETRLTQLLDDATRPEPPMGPVVTASMRAGDRLRRRQRISAIAITAAVTAFAVTAFAVALSYRPAPAAPATVHRTGVAFIESPPQSVVAVDLSNGRASRPIRVPISTGLLLYASSMASAPDGLTVWVVGNTELTPINTRTDRPGPSIHLNARGATTAVIGADGTRAYVALQAGDVLVVDLTTGKVLTKIKTSACYYMAVSPDGKLVYAYAYGKIMIIGTAANSVLRTVPLLAPPYKISVAPDSTTAYAFVEHSASFVHSRVDGWVTEVERINAATGATKTFTIRNSGAAALAPDAALLYAAGQGALYAVSPVTGKTVGRWSLPLKSVSALAISHDGSAAFALGYAPGRTPKAVLVIVSLHSGHAERPVHLPYLIAGPFFMAGHPYEAISTTVQDMQVSPDGQTAYVELISASRTMYYALAVAVRSGAIIASTAGAAGLGGEVAFGR